jgi:hypothetical protein
MRTETKLIKTKLGLINLAEHLGNVSQACRMMGYSRDRSLSAFVFILSLDLSFNGIKPAFKPAFYLPFKPCI